MTKLTRKWVRKAEGDYRVAAAIARATEPFHDQLCFHCQQPAEKYLKALLQERGQPVPKIHDLDDLLQLLLPTYKQLRPLRRALSVLSDFAVDSRYPGKN